MLNKYQTLITIMVLISSNTFFYYQGKENGINEQLKIDEELRASQTEFHQKQIEKLNNSLKNVKYNPKRDYNFTGNLDDDQLLQALE
jgi:hypothetical protein